MTTTSGRRIPGHVVGLGIALVVFLAAVLFMARQAPQTEATLSLRELHNTEFAAPPPRPDTGTFIASLWHDFHGRPGERLLESVFSEQGVVLLIAFAVMLFVAFDFDQPRISRHFELAALLGMGLLLFNIMRFFELLDDPVYFWLMDLVFTGIVTMSMVWIGLALWRVRHPHKDAWIPNLSVKPLMALTVALLALNIWTAMTHAPDDAGFYTNLGAQRLRERGKMPYGDPLLTNSAGAGYGTLLYLGHLPFQFALNPTPLNDTQPTRDDLAAGARYVLPPTLASQLTTITFHVIGVASIITIGMQLATPAVGWALAALYCSSAYVLGVGGGSETIGGITFISHIAPPAVSMLAFAFLARPFIAGFMLVAASMTVFFPALFFPAWLGYYWDRRPSMIKFIGGCVLGAAVFVLPTIALSQALPDHSVVSTVLKESVGHHQGTDTYGLSTFGFWGQRGGIRDWFREPFIEGQFTTSPMFLITIGFAAVMFFMARHTRRWQLALITATVGIIAQWSKIHGTGVYVNWYYPFLLIGLLAARPSAPALPVEHGDDGAGALGAAQHAN